jgi:hypothetical protein
VGIRNLPKGVDEDDVRKAAFLAGYARLCRQHGMMVAMEHVGDDDEVEAYLRQGGPYNAFVVIDFSAEPEALMQALEEMRLEDVRWVSTPEDEGDDGSG